MGFYDSVSNVQQYMSMSVAYDGSFLINRLQCHLPAGASLLELGMGPGKDLDLLKQAYEVIGSDNSKVFLDLYKKHDAEQALLRLDAITLKTDRTFDCIYSNKVLQHLTEDELVKSIGRQYQLLHEGGMILHSFWAGDTIEMYDGLRFVYYTDVRLNMLFCSKFEIVDIGYYKENEDDDSIYLIARKL